MLPLKNNYYENLQNSLLEPISPSLEMTLDKMMDEFPFLYNIMEGMLGSRIQTQKFFNLTPRLPGWTRKSNRL